MNMVALGALSNMKDWIKNYTKLMELSKVKEGYPLLKNAPPHDSPDFIDYLRDNNVVVEETSAWILIENCKYHTKKKPWLTLFAKEKVDGANWIELKDWLKDYADWEWLKKKKEIQTVERFHIHLIK